MDMSYPKGNHPRPPGLRGARARAKTAEIISTPLPSSVLPLSFVSKIANLNWFRLRGFYSRRVSKWILNFRCLVSWCIESLFQVNSSKIL